MTPATLSDEMKAQVRADLVKELRASRPLEITNPADVQAFIQGNHRIRLEAARRIEALERALRET